MTKLVSGIILTVTMITLHQIKTKVSQSYGPAIRDTYSHRIEREAEEIYSDHCRDTEYRIIRSGDARYGVPACYDSLGLSVEQLIAFGWVHARSLGTRTGPLNGAVNYARHILTDYDFHQGHDKAIARERALHWIAATWPELAATCKQQSVQRWQDVEQSVQWC